MSRKFFIIVCVFIVLLFVVSVCVFVDVMFFLLDVFSDMINRLFCMMLVLCKFDVFGICLVFFKILVCVILCGLLFGNL